MPLSSCSPDTSVASEKIASSSPSQVGYTHVPQAPQSFELRPMFLVLLRVASCGIKNSIPYARGSSSMGGRVSGNCALCLMRGAVDPSFATRMLMK